jgi:hypothetical protein
MLVANTVANSTNLFLELLILVIAFPLESHTSIRFRNFGLADTPSAAGNEAWGENRRSVE